MSSEPDAVFCFSRSCANSPSITQLEGAGPRLRVPVAIAVALGRIVAYLFLNFFARDSTEQFSSENKWQR